MPYEEIHLNSGDSPDCVEVITLPTGGEHDVTYKPSAQYRDSSDDSLNPELPFSIPTVSSIEHDADSGPVVTTDYVYEGGKYYYDGPYDRQFSGFAAIIETDADSNSIKRFFHQGDDTNSSQGEYSDEIHKVSKQYRSEIRDDQDDLISKTITKWDSYDLGDDRKFVKRAQVIDSVYDGDTDHKDKAGSFSFSNTTGNLTEGIEWGEVIGSDAGTFTDTGSDKFTTSISYAIDTGTVVVGLPSQETVTNQSASKVKESKYYYDSQSHGVVTDGNLTKQEDWVTGTTYIDIEKTYNSTYGLVASETDPRGKTTSYSYDTHNLYPDTVTNPLSQETDYTYDYSSGRVKQVTDVNDRVFQTTYDGLDRVLTEKQPDIDTPTTLVTAKSYVYTDTSGAVSIKESASLDGSTTADSYTYFDGLGRVLQERKEAEGTDYAARDYAYDDTGNLLKESLPYFSTGSAKTTATSTSSLYTNYTYDALGRMVSAVNDVGTTTTAYDDWTKTVTDANGNDIDLTTDAYGNLVTVIEHNDTSDYTTAYEYNYLGNLIKVTDALGNVRNFAYDGLGRRLTAQDLHDTSDSYYSSWSYSYDDASNLTSRTDGKSQTVNYTYDDLGRVSTEDYTGDAGTEVTYTYDSGTDGEGRLTSVANGDVTKEFGYNALGLVDIGTVTIDSTDYVSEYDYDRQGNQTLITNPDDSEVKYAYNNAGLLETVERKETTDGSYVDVVDDFDYSPLGQITFVDYENGVSTTNTYDSTELYRLSTKVTTDGVDDLQSLTYTYDAVGNITDIVDDSDTDSSKTVEYTYDDLNRLTAATATDVASGQSTYSETYAYDAIGNITSKTGQGSYSYDGDTGTSYANPHAVTSIGSTTITYDQNGNMTAEGSSLSNTWDYNNRLIEVDTGSVTSTYEYDHAGSRSMVSDGSTTTYYPTGNYNVTDSTPTKHITANGITVATVEGAGSGAEVYSVHTDHLTGASVVTDDAGDQEQLLDYFPYGSIRIDEKAASFDEQRKYAGHEYDSDTELSYMGARYYDGATGRFLSQDPIGQQVPETFLADPQRANTYAYARNNPMNRIDPTGLYDMRSGAVEDGDTLSGITSQINSHYGLNYSYQTISAINGISDPDSIAVGSTIRVGTIDGFGNTWTPPRSAGGIDRAYWGSLSGPQQRILHYHRNFYQGDIPATTGDMNSGEWSNVGKSGTHNLNGTFGNIDYRGRGARSGQQAIYDGNGNLVTSPENIGSYDFAPPMSPQVSNHYWLDVNPWIAWGNSPADSTTSRDRSGAMPMLLRLQLWFSGL